jgi:hypothetical protein
MDGARERSEASVGGSVSIRRRPKTAGRVEARACSRAAQQKNVVMTRLRARHPTSLTDSEFRSKAPSLKRALEVVRGFFCLTEVMVRALAESLK